MCLLLTFFHCQRRHFQFFIEKKNIEVLEVALSVPRKITRLKGFFSPLALCKNYKVVEKIVKSSPSGTIWYNLHRSYINNNHRS